MKAKLILGCFLLILLSLLIGVYSFFSFSPWTFFVQLSIGSLLGLGGFLLLTIALYREIKNRNIF